MNILELAPKRDEKKARYSRDLTPDDRIPYSSTPKRAATPAVANLQVEEGNAPGEDVGAGAAVNNVYSWKFVGAQPIRDLTVIDVNSFRINAPELSLLWNHSYDAIIGKAFDFDIREDDGLYGKVEFDVEDERGAAYERQVRAGYLRTVSIGIMAMPNDIEMLEPENEDWWSWGFYFGPEKWNNPELLEVSMTPVPRDITAQRQYEASLADVEERRVAALETRARHIASWHKALGMEPLI